MAEISLEEKFETDLKKSDEEKEQKSEADIPNFRVGFLEFFGGRQAANSEKDDHHDEDNSSGELDDFHDQPGNLISNVLAHDPNFFSHS